jgi:acetylornithine deacetylase/succinyl-diaminopimelate desuccinylase-like protein
VYARGAADDKVTILPVLAAEAMFQVNGSLPGNLKCLFEGQEEILSPELPDFLRRHSDVFACDVVISADGAQWSTDQPSVLLGYRGLAAVGVCVSGAEEDLASGGHGGGIQNPIHALARILAARHSPEGRILVPGFCDRVVEPTPEVRASNHGCRRVLGSERRRQAC